MRDRMARLLGGRRRKAVFGGAVAVAAAGVFAISAIAVHDEAFQLDGDMFASTTTNYGGNTQLYDWDSIFDSAGTTKPLPTGFTAAGFQKDFKNTGTVYNTDDTSTYTQGSKDQSNIATNWVCADANNVTNKGDIQNAYVTAYTDPVTHDQKLYFALERSSNNGDANVAFWFLQDPTADCSTASGTKPWTGNHVDGDILIVSAFTKGGSVSNISAYRWNGGAGGSLGTTAVAGGGDCRAASQSLGDAICATANAASLSNVPWLTNNNGASSGLGHSLLTGEFFEGGINLTKSNLAGKCFNTFVADTRSSQQLTATLYDFARGTLGECHSTTVTTPTPGAGTSTTIPASAQVTSSDSATVTVVGVEKFSGTVKFSLCGPLAAGGTDNCKSGGVAISTQTLTDATSPATVGSGNVTLTEVGRYCWRAEYSGDSVRGVPPSSDPPDATSQTECFTITPRTPDMTTCSGVYSGSPLSCTPDGTVDFGQSVRDNANLTGTANRPGTGGLGDGSINPTGGNGPAQGTITFKLYGPDTAGSTTHCNDLAAGFPSAGLTKSVNGDGVYGPVSFTPQAPGVYHWKATYGGDSPNTNSKDTNSSCNDTNEDVTVRQVPTDIKTKQSWFPNDTATITSTASGDTLGAGGKVDFTLHASADCTGAALYSEQRTLTGGNHSEEVGTRNHPGTTATDPNGNPVIVYREDTNYSDAADSSVSRSWEVVYTPAPGDTAHLGSSSACTTPAHTEKHTITYTNDPGH